jgi:hypothetical protein
MYTYIYEAMSKNPGTHWRTHDVREAFTEELCEVRNLDPPF